MALEFQHECKEGSRMAGEILKISPVGIGMGKYLKNFLAGFLSLALIICLAGCEYALQRGMLGDAYISTARPSITLEAKNMPLLAAGQGSCNLVWSDMLGGLPVQMWLAVYGTGGLAPLAIVAQAQVPEGWQWDGIMRRPFSVDDGVEVFDGVGYQACTFIVDPSNDPFSGLVTGVKPDGQPQMWLVRAFAARYNFNVDKIIMEYREPLPSEITSLTALPFGQGDFLQKFNQRARDAFVVAAGPKNPKGVTQNYIQGILWQYMGPRFLGSASPNIRYNSFD